MFRTDRDGSDAARDSGGGERFGRAAGSEARHGIPDPGGRNRPLLACVRRARHARTVGARERGAAGGGGDRRTALGPRGVRAGIGGFAGGGPPVRGRAGRRRNGAVFALAGEPGPEVRATGGGHHRIVIARPASPVTAAAAPARDGSLMRILLAQNSLYYPSHGGGDKSNRMLMEALAARGHVCRAVARIPVFGAAEEARDVAELVAGGGAPRGLGGGAPRRVWRGGRSTVRGGTGGARGGAGKKRRRRHGGIRASGGGGSRGRQCQSAGVLRRAGGDVPARCHPGFDRRPGASPSGGGVALAERPDSLSGASHDGLALWAGLRLSERGEYGADSLGRPRGGGQ